MKLHWIATACLVAACGNKRSQPEPAPAPPIVAAAPVAAPSGLALRLSNGAQGAPVVDRTTLAPATPLPDAEVAALLARTPPLAPAQPVAFALRPGSQPPPAGQTVAVAFPPPASTPPAVATGELRVLRATPEGPVPIVPEVSVTFSQPMVAVTSQADAARTVPVTLTPPAKGTWRWLGTRTVIFDPEVRLPQATAYTIEVPAGTKSASGATLGAAFRVAFQTPPPTMVESWPAVSPQRRDVPMFVRFDQAIDPTAMLRRIRVTANQQTVPTRLVTEVEASATTELREKIERARADGQADRWLAFRAATELPADSEIVIQVERGAPSKEGPRTTEDPQSFSFRTYPPLRLDKARCGWTDDEPCRPDAALRFEMTNVLDATAFDPALVRVAPKTPDLQILREGADVVIYGHKTPNTRYTVTIGKELRDAFGQTLPAPVTGTFSVGAEEPALVGPSGVIVLDPMAARPALAVFSTGQTALGVTLYRVTPADYPRYLLWLDEDRTKPRSPPPGTKVVDTTVPVTAQGALAETAIDLAPALANGRGHVLAIVRPLTRQPEITTDVTVWAQATHIGIDYAGDATDAQLFVTSLDTGAPLAGAQVVLEPTKQSATTDARGLATLPKPAGERAPTVVPYWVARHGDDTALFAVQTDRWSRRTVAPATAWYVTDDRALYRPGERVSLKGWLRSVDRRKGGDVALPEPALRSVAFRVRDSAGKELATGSAPIDALGGFALTFTLPATPNLGRARVELTANTARYEHAFRIEEFRRPEIEVTTTASQGPFFVGESGDITASGRYFTGAPLPGAKVNWSASATPTSFSPPNRSDYTFGTWTPWWLAGPSLFDEGEWGTFGSETGPTYRHEGTTDATGVHVLHLDFLSMTPARPMSVTAHATVHDVDRQTWTASESVLVHPASAYVGLRAKQPFVDRGAPYELDAIGVDLDGALVANAKITISVTRSDWVYEKGEYVEKKVEPQTCTVTTEGHCTFTTAKGGRYEALATIVDAKGRTNTTTLQYWVSGGDPVPSRGVQMEELSLVPDKATYAPGDTAQVLVQAPFAPAEGIVTWRRDGIVKTERITLAGSSAIVRVPIDDAMTPGLRLQVDVVGTAPRTNALGAVDPAQPPRPAYASGGIELAIPPKHRALTVVATPAAAKVTPGATTEVELAITDAAGAPVANAQALVIVVDEAVLALANTRHRDPLATFYAPRGAGVDDDHSRRMIALAIPPARKTATADDPSTGFEDSNVYGGMVGGDLRERAIQEARVVGLLTTQKGYSAGFAALTSTGDFAQAMAPAITLRTNFDPLAVFAPEVTTDASGKATVAVTMPDNLTRYRIVAIAAAGPRQFGTGESAVTARLPLMVRPRPPRFLNFGDVFELPVVVQNQTDAPMTVKLAARATNLALTAGSGRVVTVPANDRVEVRFPAAAELAGSARVQLVAASDAASDAAEVALPVWTPATTEAFATHGVIDAGAIAQPVALPGKVVTTFGGLDVTLASTNLQALTDAMIYVVRYPFDCAEQRASRILTIAALRDVLSAFAVRGVPTKVELEASMTRDLEQLARMQAPGGGFAFWRASGETYPYLTVHVMHALARAKAKGYAVPAPMLAAGLEYLRTIERQYPSDYPPEVRRGISAYALYVRRLLGERDLDKARAIATGAGGAENLGLETAAWLLSAIAGEPTAAGERAAIVKLATTKLRETAGAANFSTSYTDGGHLLLASDRRVDALMLEALIAEQPTLDVIPKLVTGLLADARGGHWLNTQENVFAMIALERYFQTYEKQTPSFVARAWLGADSAGEQAFRGRSTTAYQISVPMTAVAAHDGQPLTLAKVGTGRLYYRIGMTYAPASLTLAAADHGFVVERRYEGVDDPADVTRNAQGTWHVKSGARVRVVVTLVNEDRRYHVALVDPLPAGLEAVNPELSGAQPDVPRPAQSSGRARSFYRWWSPWYEHENLRDERVEAFATYLYEGVHEYTYVTRATTPGTFVVPPPKAEEMYMPETFGRGASDRVIIR